MSREIEEMAKIMCEDAGTKNCNITCNAKPICDVHFYAERLYKEGYRKQNEDFVIGSNESIQNTIVIGCKKIILAQESIGVEIEATEAFKRINTIIVNGVEFRKE